MEQEYLGNVAKKIEEAMRNPCFRRLCIIKDDAAVRLHTDLEGVATTLKDALTS